MESPKHQRNETSILKNPKSFISSPKSNYPLYMKQNPQYNYTKDTSSQKMGTSLIHQQYLPIQRQDYKLHIQEESEKKLEKTKELRKRWLKISHNPKVTKNLAIKIKQNLSQGYKELSQSPQLPKYICLKAMKCSYTKL